MALYIVQLILVNNFFSIGFYNHYYYADILPSLMDFSINTDIW
jgi:hypothetical protein